MDKDLRVEGMPVKASAAKPFVVGVRTWQQAIPQFNVGHVATITAAKQALADAQYNGIKLGGNYVCGVALGKCVEYGYTFADELAAEVASRK